MTGRINSFQSLGTLDGPGVRFVVFLQGCPLRCGCCHNPETQSFDGGEEYTAESVVNKALRYKSYFGADGGITVSGGEPLLQSEFVREVFELAHKRGINTCLDTSGCIINDSVEALLDVTDCVLLDLKYANDADYRQYVGCGIEKPLEFLALLQVKSVPTTVRQVTIPELNGSDEAIEQLKSLTDGYSVVEKLELLPFKKICKSKYDNLGIEFRFEKYSTPGPELMKHLQSLL